MANITDVKLPDSSQYDLKDNVSGYQTENLATPITVDGTSETTVEGALGAVNDYADKIKGSMSNENFVDNPFFTVNERGASSYSTAGNYTANRWYMPFGGLTVGISSSGATLTATGDTVLDQKFETDELKGKTVTLSIKHFDGTIEQGTVQFPSTAGTNPVVITGGELQAGVDTYGNCYFRIVILTGNTITARAVKLELGSISTLANDVAPDHALELAKCQTSTADPSDVYANQGQLMTSALQGVLGAKNLNAYPYKDTTKSSNGITFTDNGNGSVTVSGLASANAIFDMHLYLDTPCIINNGNYILSGCPSGGGVGTYGIRVYSKNQGGTDVIIGNDYGNGANLLLNGDYYSNDSVHLDLAIVIQSGTNISTPITFYPMICDARMASPTFAPYAKTNKQLTDEIKEIKYKKVNINFASTDFEAQSGGLVAYKNIATDVGGSVNFDGCFVSQIDGVYRSCCCAIRGIDSSTTYLVAKTFDPSAPNVTITVLYH